MTQVLPPLGTQLRRADHAESVQPAEPVESTPKPVGFLEVADWRFLRAMRLAALQDAPEAFVTTYAVERRRRRREWADLLRRSRWVAAYHDEKIVGVACLPAPDEEGPRKRFIESVWVMPGLRRRGLVRLMLKELEGRARREGAEALQLWVLDTNESAADAYLKLGFDWADRVQGSSKFWPDRTPVKERLMIRSISDEDLSPQVISAADHTPLR